MTRPVSNERAPVPHAIARFSTFYATYFLVAGAMLPFWPLYLEARGLQATEIGLVLGLTLLLRATAGPFIGRFADRSGSTRGPLLVCAIAGLLVMIAFYWTAGFWPLFVASAAFTLVYAGVLPLGETLALRTVSADAGYGRVRLWGSVSYLVAAAVGGAALEIEAEPSANLIVSVVLVTVVFMVGGAFVIPDHRGAEATPGAPILRLLRDRPFRLMILATTGIHGAHAVFYGFSTLHWIAAGISEWVIGLLWAGGVVAEVVLFAAGGPLVRRAGPAGLFGLAAGLGVVRWAVLASTTEIWALALAQCLHAFTFGAMHLGAMLFIARTVPSASANTAQALFAALTNGIGLGAGLLIAGLLYSAWGADAYWASAAVSAAGGFATVLLWRATRAANRPQ
jgi:PPP family 3-phenylpropionic acid transporter